MSWSEPTQCLISMLHMRDPYRVLKHKHNVLLKTCSEDNANESFIDERICHPGRSQSSTDVSHMLFWGWCGCCCDVEQYCEWPSAIRCANASCVSLQTENLKCLLMAICMACECCCCCWYVMHAMGGRCKLMQVSHTMRRVARSLDLDSCIVNVGQNDLFDVARIMSCCICAVSLKCALLHLLMFFNDHEL